jgi:hypothetical protein
MFTQCSQMTGARQGAFGPYRHDGPGLFGRPGGVPATLREILPQIYQLIVRALLSCHVWPSAAQVTAGYLEDGSMVTCS